MFLSLPRGTAFFFLHKNVKLHNPIGNLDGLQLAAWVLVLGTPGRGRRCGGGGEAEKEPTEGDRERGTRGVGTSPTKWEVLGIHLRPQDCERRPSP